MSAVDVWFARYEGQLYVSITDAGQEPMLRPKRASSVRYVFKRLREKKAEINQVGILDPEMLGLM